MKGRLLLTDVKKLSPTHQTSSLESFHSLVCSYTSKSVHYFHAQMEARSVDFLFVCFFAVSTCKVKTLEWSSIFFFTKTFKEIHKLKEHMDPMSKFEKIEITVFIRL